MSAHVGVCGPIHGQALRSVTNDDPVPTTFAPFGSLTVGVSAGRCR
jgi:hypothetical protein